jgi:DNA-directed RNA polymerase delta subunit
MIGSFRQPIGIPDDILPDSWRNIATSSTNDNDEQTCNAEENDDQNCQLMENDNNDEDPCAPYNNYNNTNNSDNNYDTHDDDDDDDDLPTSTSSDDEFRFSYSSLTSAMRSTRGHLYRGT